ncbi:MAG: hypothetical protein HRU19_03665 [Pseudobacteriovorax sp.]|nr:hypothetical protein [Pseudobacteriovorax sp.]
MKMVLMVAAISLYTSATAADLKVTDILQYGQLEVIDPDPTGLNCHWDFHAPNPNTAAKLQKGEIYSTDSNLYYNSTGKPYAWVWYDASGCFVRANTRYVRTVANFFDMRQDFFEGASDWMVFVVADASSDLNCRANLTNQFNEVVTTLKQGETISYGAAPEIPGSHSLIDIDYRNNKPWVRISIQTETDAETACWIRANTRYFREVDGREFLSLNS